MLVLTRRKDEKLLITTPSGPLTITLAELRGSSARIGIEAPPDWKVDRLNREGAVEVPMMSSQSHGDSHSPAHSSATPINICPKCHGPMLHSRLNGYFCQHCRNSP